VEPGADSFPSFSLDPLEERGPEEGAVDGDGPEVVVVKTGADEVLGAVLLVDKLPPLAELTKEVCCGVKGWDEVETSRFLETTAMLSDFFNPEEDEVFLVVVGAKVAEEEEAKFVPLVTGNAAADVLFPEEVVGTGACWGSAKMVKGEGEAVAPF